MHHHYTAGGTNNPAIATTENIDSPPVSPDIADKDLSDYSSSEEPSEDETVSISDVTACMLGYSCTCAHGSAYKAT